eukprot:Nk52_evm6s169 gene=Nk52_evmTU6s169
MRHLQSPFVIRNIESCFGEKENMNLYCTPKKNNTKRNYLNFECLNNSISPKIKDNALKLVRAKAIDKLAISISERPTEEELIERNILKADDGLKHSISPKLLEKARKLVKAQFKDELAYNISERPTVEELIERNILLSSPLDHSSEHHWQEKEIKLQNAKDVVEKVLQQRKPNANINAFIRAQ